MDDELVLLTSYFNLADGRRQDQANTFRVEPELFPAEAAGSTAALYIVTEASTGGAVGTRARKRAADTVAWEYSSHDDVPPATRLKAALRTAHETLVSEFDGHVSVGMSVMAVDSDTVYLGQVAPAQVYVLHEGGLHSLPAGGGSEPFSRSLGSSAGPKIYIFRDEIGADDVVALCSSWYHTDADASTVRDSFEGDTGDAIAELLLEKAQAAGLADATAIIVEAAREHDIPARSDTGTISWSEHIDQAVQALSNVGRMIITELRPAPANGARSGNSSHHQDTDWVEAVPSPDSGSHEVVKHDLTTEVPVIRQQTREMPAVEALSGDEDDKSPGGQTAPEPPSRRHPREQATDEVPSVAPNEATSSNSTDQGPRSLGTAAPWASEIESDEAPQRRSASEPVSEIDQVNSRIQSAPQLGDIIPPVQGFSDTSIQPERIYATSKDIQAVNKRPRRFGGITGRKESPPGPTVIRPPISDIDLSRPAGRPAPPATVYLGAAVMLVLVVVAAFLYLRKPHRVATNPFPHRLRVRLVQARNAKTAAQQAFFLQTARTDLSLARQHGTTKKQLARLSAEIQTTDDQIHHVIRIKSPQLLSDFGKYVGAHPTQIVSVPGQVFVLDSGRHGVFSVTPLATSNPALVMQRGDNLNGFTLGEPRLIAAAGSTVLALDDHDTLVRANAAAKSATSITKNDPKEVISALASAPPDVYVLDPPNNEVWRFASGSTAFNPYGQAFFTPPLPDLKGAQTVSFDQSSMFILKGAGRVLKFEILNANPQPFALTVQPALSQPTVLFTEQGLNYVWIADPGTGRIVQFDKSGHFIRTYESGSADMNLHSLTSFSVGPAGNTLYVLCGSKLFTVPITK